MKSSPIGRAGRKTNFFKGRARKVYTKDQKGEEIGDFEEICRAPDRDTMKKTGLL